MKPTLLPRLCAVLLPFAGCASPPPPVHCAGEFYPIVLSPAHRREEGIALVAISPSRRVTVRLPLHGGRLAYARPGQAFTLADGSTAPGFYQLRSADPATGRVVVEGVSFVMTR